MRTSPLTLIVLIVCASMIAACANWLPAPAPAPPQHPILPELATRPCPLATLAETATWADLEEAYLLRGRQLVECDLARRLAVETLEAERRAAAGL